MGVPWYFFATLFFYNVKTLWSWSLQWTIVLGFLVHNKWLLKCFVQLTSVGYICFKSIGISFTISTMALNQNLHCLKSNFWERVRATKIRTSKVKKNIENLKRIRTSKVSIKRIRTLKDHNNDNYLWCSTYGYQGLWGARLGSVRLGLVRIG